MVSGCYLTSLTTGGVNADDSVCELVLFFIYRQAIKLPPPPKKKGIFLNSQAKFLILTSIYCTCIWFPLERITIPFSLS